MADKFQLKALITGVDRLSPMLKGVQKNAMIARKKLESSGLGKIGFDDLIKGGAIAAPFLVGVRAAMQFESKMADVKKVVDFDSPAQFAQMSKDVLGLSRELPMAASGIAEIVAAGGQAGIPRAELQGFARDAVKMGVAFDQTADQSGQMMATWRTSFRIGQSEVVELADKINYLGNTGPATTKQISAIVTRLGPLGEVAGLANGQIAAMGATLAGVGISEEVAATGMKNFALTLTAGAAATKAQSQTFKALRLDAKQVAASMQKDAQGTIMKVLTAISKVDKTQQSAVLSQMFGKESIGAIAPMLTNLDKLQENFMKVADATQYAGSMNKEYEARAQTTENNLQLLQNRATEAGVAIGNVFLPAINDATGALGPIISSVADLASANPWMVKTVLGAAVGFGVLRLAVMGTTAAIKIMSAVTSMSPIGIAVRVIAVGAGMLIANWSKVAPFFATCWAGIKSAVTGGWELIKTVAGFTPIGFIMKNWEPIVQFFKRIWDRIRPYVEPIMNGASWIGDKIGGLFGGDSEPRSGSATIMTSPIADQSAPRAAATSPIQKRQSPLTSATASALKQQLNGEMVLRFENAPAGLKVDSVKTNQPGIDFSAQGGVGRRTLAGGYQ